MRGRTSTRLAALLALALALAASPASAQTGDAGAPADDPMYAEGYTGERPAPDGPAAVAHLVETDIYEMIFPVVGDVYYEDTFGAPRSGGRTHAGTDLMADKMTPVVAVADGVIGGDYASGVGGWFSGEGDCCAMTIEHDDGWSSWYIHLNNDTPGTDDGLGWGFAEGIEPGVRVTAGQLVGWVGDSGNAEWTAPHVHFELHDPNDVVVNPYPHLLAATVLEEPGGEPAAPDYFWDDDGDVHEENINRFYELGITRGCNPPDNDMFCPYDTLTRGHVAAFLRRHLALPDAVDDYYVDDDGHLFEADVNALTEVGVAFGCTEFEYCPDAPLTRAEMAQFLVSAFGYENPDALDLFVDDDGNVYETAINALAANEITLGCNPPDNDQFCPDDSLTRAQIATFIIRAIDDQAASAPGA